MSQQHSTFKWQKKSSIQTLQKLIFHANIFRKKLTDFQREILARKKKVGHYLHLWNTLFHPVLLQIRKSRKRKEKLHHFFMKRREKSFPLVLKLLPTSLCFVSWHWRHIIQELGTNIKKGEKTDRVDSPSRKEILKASNVWNTSDKKITFLQSYCAFLPLFPLSSPISCLFLFQRTIASEMCGSNSNPKVKPVLSYFPAPSPLLMRGVRELLMLGTELLGHKKKERKPQRILPLRFFDSVVCPSHSHWAQSHQPHLCPAQKLPSEACRIWECAQGRNTRALTLTTLKPPLGTQLLCNLGSNDTQYL